MKNALPARVVAAVLAAAVPSAFFASGCEDADSYSISVSPNYARVKGGQSVTLNASGWENYQWSLDNENGAHLSATTGKSVVFYAETGASNAVYNVTATAVGSGSSAGSGTNSVSSAGYTAKAKIVVQ
ncbi:MAG: hypothetical protein IJL06_08515 [Kiritimatiellae bacterium]|nr:hypothetical protein [Kiritimatiellia bacterium]